MAWRREGPRTCASSSALTPPSSPRWQVKPLGADHLAFAVEYRGAKGQSVTVTVRWQNPDGTQGSRVVD